MLATFILKVHVPILFQMYCLFYTLQFDCHRQNSSVNRLRPSRSVFGEVNMDDIAYQSVCVCIDSEVVVQSVSLSLIAFAINLRASAIPLS